LFSIVIATALGVPTNSNGEKNIKEKNTNTEEQAKKKAPGVHGGVGEKKREGRTE